MYDKLLAYFFSYLGIAACCIGVPPLITVLGDVGIFAWSADNTLAVIGLGLFGIALILFNRDPKKRRRLGTRRQRAVEYPVADAAWPSTPRCHHRPPGRRPQIDKPCGTHR